MFVRAAHMCVCVCVCVVCVGARVCVCVVGVGARVCTYVCVCVFYWGGGGLGDVRE